MKADLMSLALRICFAGTLLLAHGIGKLTMVAEGYSEFPDPLGIGPGWSLILTIFGEVVCAGLLLFGLFSRLASAALVFQMCVIIFAVHGMDGGFRQLEIPLFYSAAFIAIIIGGGGKFSIGYLIFGKNLAQL